MILEKVFSYRKLCQTYQKYRFVVGGSSSSLEEVNIDQLEWINVNQPKREDALMELYQTEDPA